MKPLILKSDLTNPPRWYVATRYTLKHGINAKTGEFYYCATTKYDVTEQMEEILRKEKHL